MYAEWPSSGEVDHLLTVASKFVFNTIDRFQKQQKAMFESKTRQVIFHFSSSLETSYKFLLEILKSKLH